MFLKPLNVLVYIKQNSLEIQDKSFLSCEFSIEHIDVDKIFLAKQVQGKLIKILFH